ncbi:YvcK family protein [Candidatus Woesearchaeota archaeon]|nr:YvcK family protein [Candidatus Woesearchaeota archaeon]
MKKVVVIGGGTGNFVVLRGLKKYPIDLSAIVSMADDGGSTGVLRDELGVLPPGDIRQCMVALSDSSRLMRGLMNYRFDNGSLDGHNFGNILLSALEKVTGSFDRALEEAHRILSIKGKVIPVTTNKVRLKMVLHNNKLLDGEKEIDVSQELDQGFKSMYLEPFPKAHDKAIDQIMTADLIVFSPADIYTSLIPNLLVDGICKALTDSEGTKVLIANLMNKNGQTTNFKVSNYLSQIKRFVGKDIFDHILINNATPSENLLRIYAEEGTMVGNDLQDDPRTIIANLISDEIISQKKSDVVKRSLIRHDSKKIAAELMKIVDNI